MIAIMRFIINQEFVGTSDSKIVTSQVDLRFLAETPPKAPTLKVNFSIICKSGFTGSGLRVRALSLGVYPRGGVSQLSLINVIRNVPWEAGTLGVRQCQQTLLLLLLLRVLLLFRCRRRLLSNTIKKETFVQ